MCSGHIRDFLFQSHLPHTAHSRMLPAGRRCITIHFPILRWSLDKCLIYQWWHHNQLVLHTDLEFSQYSDSRYWTTDISANNDSQQIYLPIMIANLIHNFVQILSTCMYFWLIQLISNSWSNYQCNTTIKRWEYRFLICSSSFCLLPPVWESLPYSLRASRQ